VCCMYDLSIQSVVCIIFTILTVLDIALHRPRRKQRGNSTEQNQKGNVGSFQHNYHNNMAPKKCTLQKVKRSQNLKPYVQEGGKFITRGPLKDKSHARKNKQAGPIRKSNAIAEVSPLRSSYPINACNNLH